MVNRTSHKHRDAGRRRPAFTLVELIAVMVIVGVLAAVAVPAISTTPTMRARVACRELARDLAFARVRSITTGVAHWVTFNTTADMYAMLAESTTTPGRSGATAYIEPSTGVAFTRTLNTGDFAGVDLLSVTLGTGAELGFDWRGRPLDSTSTLLTSQGIITLSGSQSVTIEPGTGLVAFTP